MYTIARAFVLACLWAFASAATLHAQKAQLDSLITAATRNRPTVAAASARVDAAKAAVRRAAALPDPMLMAGIENLPLGKDMGEEGPDMMTMRMLGVSLTLPFPGKLGARRRAAEQQVAIAEARLEAIRRQIAFDVSTAYYELLYRERALQIVTAAEAASRDAERAAEARYVAGLGEQRGVLDARVATARFAEQTIAIEQERIAARAQVEAALADSFPISMNAIAIRQFLSRSIPAGLPSVLEMQELAIRNNAELAVRRAEIAMRAAELGAARKEYLPDIDMSLRYGQRSGRPDMISASVAVPLPLQKGRKQDEMVRGAEAELAATQADLREQAVRVRAEVVAAHTELERIRQQISLFQRSILPQARAALESATTALVTGKIELFSVVQRQTELLEYELALERLLVDFRQKVAQLTNIIGTEVLP